MKLFVTFGTATLAAAMFLSGCVSTAGTAMQTHKKGMESVTDDEYVVPKKPVDRHFIGSAWSKQFGPVEDPGVADIRVKKEKSFSGIQQDFAYNRGIALGGTPSMAPVQAEISLQGGSVEKSKLAGLEIITPVNIGDVPFELEIPYITEALRLANFKISDEKSNKAQLNVGVGAVIGNATATAEVGSQARRGTEGDGLVVAYKLHKIDKDTYKKQDTGTLKLDLDKTEEKGGLILKAKLQNIEPGASKSLPRNLVWACARADAMSRDMVAAWLVELKSLDPKRKSLTIAFPAHPKVEDCSNYSSVIFAKINPVTDNIERQKINVTVVDAEVTDTLRPKLWDARISLVDETFKIKPVNPVDVQ
ncbi:MAG: hypothetical protein WCP33_04735 [Deltaproteobacteria bacterium]